MQPKEDEVLPKAPEECQRWKRACHFFFRTTSKEQEWILQRTALQNRTTAQQQRNRLAPQTHPTQHSTKRQTSGQKKGGVVDEGDSSRG